MPAMVDILGKILRALEGGTPTNINTATTTPIRSGKGFLERVVINQISASSVVTIYDNTEASGNPIATITMPLTLLESNPQFEYKAKLSQGLTVVTTGEPINITVVHRAR